MLGAKKSVREIVLIRVSGEDKAGITGKLTACLAEFDVAVLDIGQAVIHSNLALGMMVEAESNSAAFDALKALGDELGLKIKFAPVSEERYEQWVDEQGKSRHIVTLLARKITAKHIAKVTAVVNKFDWNIDRLDRLSGRIPLDVSKRSPNACVQFSLRGELPDGVNVRKEFLELADELAVDISYQDDNIYRRNRRLVVFDMDSTLIQAEVIDELAKVAGVGEQVSAITEQAMCGELDFKSSFTKRLALLEGLDESALEIVAGNLKLSDGAEKLVSTLKKMGYSTAIVSGGFTYFGKYLQKKLGIDYVFANELAIIDGKVTGKVEGRIVDGERKAELLRKLAENERLELEQVIAVGDGANDLPMLSIAGLGIAFRAKPVVQANAQHSLSALGLDAILYLLGLSDRDTTF